jgi:hypothetical protein
MCADRGIPRPKIDPQSAGWPHLPLSALHGPAGEFIDIIGPETEADPAGLLIDFLVTSGSFVGPGPHMIADGARHTGRLFAVLVGDTSKARKGTVRANVHRFFREVDEAWANTRVSTGLTTGEGLIKAVCDPDGPGPYLGDETWVLDYEPEFARVLSTASRDGNTLSATLRQAWDQERLQVMTRKEPLLATRAHVSVIAHITLEEIERKLNDIEIANGFANRFLFAAVQRSRVLPSGGSPDELKLKALALKVRRRLTDARSYGEMGRSPDADSRWNDIYTQLAEFSDQGLVGAVTARAEAQILRLSIIYALLDGSRKVECVHVNAAVSLWTYCSDSAKGIFGGSTGHPLQTLVLSHVRRAGPSGMDRQAIHSALGRHTKAKALGAALERLRSDGKIVTRKEKTGGRPREVAIASEFEKSERSNRSELGPSAISLTSLSGDEGLFGEPDLTSDTSLISPSELSQQLADLVHPEVSTQEPSISEIRAPNDPPTADSSTSSGSPVMRELEVLFKELAQQAHRDEMPPEVESRLRLAFAEMPKPAESRRPKAQ